MIYNNVLWSHAHHHYLYGACAGMSSLQSDASNMVKLAKAIKDNDSRWSFQKKHSSRDTLAACMFQFSQPVYSFVDIATSNLKRLKSPSPILSNNRWAPPAILPPCRVLRTSKHFTIKYTRGIGESLVSQDFYQQWPKADMAHVHEMLEFASQLLPFFRYRSAALLLQLLELQATRGSTSSKLGYPPTTVAGVS
jgi:hypothetical protein